jgi:septal ring factor EnvC (AmiA/AmiB activator)
MSESKPAVKSKRKLPTLLIGILASFALLAILIIALGIKDSRLKGQVADDEKQLADAKKDDSQTQTQLAQANAKSADLQTQLNKANDQLKDAKSQVDQAKQATAGLQAQMDRATVQMADIQSQLDKSKAQSADLVNQLNDATAGSARMLTQIDQDRIQAMDLQDRLHKAESDIAQLQPLLLKTGRIPVTASFEKAAGGRNFTLHISNLYPEPLSVNVAVAGAETHRSQSAVIGGSGSFDVEKLTAGESVVIASSGYPPLDLTVQ